MYDLIRFMDNSLTSGKRKSSKRKKKENERADRERELEGWNVV